LAIASPLRKAPTLQRGLNNNYVFLVNLVKFLFLFIYLFIFFFIIIFIATISGE